MCSRIARIANNGNGSSGFSLADANSKSLIGYGIVVGVIAIIIAVMMLLKTRQKKRIAAEYAKVSPQHFGGVYGQDVVYGPYQSDIALTEHSRAPPAY